MKPVYDSHGSLVYRVSSATNTSIWQSWNLDFDVFSSAATSAATYCSTDIWQEWNTQWYEVGTANSMVIPAAHYRAIRPGIGAPAVANEALQAEIRRREDAHRREQEHIARLRREAEEKAEILLQENLTPQQRDELKRLNCFHLYIGDKKYRISRGRFNNIQLLDAQGTVVKTICAHPGPRVPNADTMLAQKLMLEHQEEAFLKIANQH